MLEVVYILYVLRKRYRCDEVDVDGTVMCIYAGGWKKKEKKKKRKKERKRDEVGGVERLVVRWWVGGWVGG